MSPTRTSETLEGLLSVLCRGWPGSSPMTIQMLSVVLIAPSGQTSSQVSVEMTYIFPGGQITAPSMIKRFSSPCLRSKITAKEGRKLKSISGRSSRNLVLYAIMGLSVRLLHTSIPLQSAQWTFLYRIPSVFGQVRDCGISITAL